MIFVHNDFVCIDEAHFLYMTNPITLFFTDPTPSIKWEFPVTLLPSPCKQVPLDRYEIPIDCWFTKMLKREYWLGQEACRVMEKDRATSPVRPTELFIPLYYIPRLDEINPAEAFFLELKEAYENELQRVRQFLVLRNRSKL